MGVCGWGCVTLHTPLLLPLLLHCLQVTPEQAERALRDTVFAWWQGSKCEAYVDTLRFLSTVDFFLPYFPLQRPQVRGRAAGQQGGEFAVVSCSVHHCQLDLFKIGCWQGEC